MADTYRGFDRDDLLDRARFVVEMEGVTTAEIDLLDEMETWDSMSLYHWLYEHDAGFEDKVRSKLVPST